MAEQNILSKQILIILHSMGISTDELSPFTLLELEATDLLARKAGGALVSRQVIASIVAHRDIGVARSKVRQIRNSEQYNIKLAQGD